MKPTTLVLLAGYCLPVPAAVHPYLIDPVITKCGPSDAGGECSSGVLYQASGIAMSDVVPLAPPLPTGSRELAAVGVHCGLGNSLTGTPFTSCFWAYEPNHTPTLAGCRLTDTKSWELDPNSTCSLSVATWGAHDGAGPGGECVVFVQKPDRAIILTALRTIYGDLSATVVANAGSSFCQKALPPAQTCEIDLPPVIDHSGVGTTDRSVVTVDGAVDCGAKPVITVLGGNTVNLGPGVASELTLHLVDGMHVRVTSTVTTTDAAAGDYNGTHVVIASPY